MADYRMPDDLRTHYDVPRNEPVHRYPLQSGLLVTSPLFVLAQLPGTPELRFRFEVEAGKLVVTRLAVVRPKGGSALSPAVLRNLPIAAITKEIRRRIAIAFDVIDQLGENALPFEAHERGEPTPLREAGVGGQHRRAVDEALLVHVVAIACANPTRPTKAVQEQLLTSHRNATRWIATARKRGMLVDGFSGQPDDGADAGTASTAS